MQALGISIRPIFAGAFYGCKGATSLAHSTMKRFV